MAVINGTGASEILTGTNLADRISGFGGSDDIAGRDGDDLIEGGAGADLLDGGNGFDQASYRGSAAGVSVYLDLGYGQGGDAQGDGLYGFEGAIGSAHSDLLVGTGGRNVLRGEGGSDSLLGAGGDDELQGGAGGDGLFGDAGFDTASYSGSGAGVRIFLDSGFADRGDAQGDSLFSIEGVIGSAFNDLLSGTEERNVLRGEGGSDHLYGNGGNDLIVGGAGGDLIQGGAGADELQGGSGVDVALFDGPDATAMTINLATGRGTGGLAEGDRYSGIEGVRGNLMDDRLIGDAAANLLGGYGGADTLTGGGGADRFFYFGGDSGATRPDRITDFSRTQGDKVVLGWIDANEQVDGRQEFAFIGKNNFSGAGQVRWYQQNGDTVVEANTTEIYAGAELKIVLDPLVNLQASDFIFDFVNFGPI